MAGAALAQSSKPNIVLFLCDDLGYREIGIYGLKHVATPNIDELARSGTRFARFYSGSPVCAPARATLMTGKHTGHAAIRGNIEIGGWAMNDPEGQAPLPAQEITLAEVLKGAGYETGCFGKWGLGGPMSEGHPLNQGFDRFFGYLDQKKAHNHFPAYLWNDRDVFLLPQNPYFDAHPKVTPGPKPTTFFDQFKGGQYAPDVIEDQAVAWLEKKRSKPFFLYFATALPHVSLQAPDSLVNQFPTSWDPEPYVTGSGYLPNLRPRATYAAMISKIDQSLGRLMSTLKATGQIENTIILFTSDNGTTFVKHVDAEFFGSTAGLRGKKGELFEGGIRVPLIVNRGKADSVSHDSVYMPDIMPTLLQMAGIQTPKGIDGLPFADVFLGKPLGANTHKFLYFEYPEGPHSQAVILDGRWKAIRSNLKQSTAIQVFDLQTDEGEKQDIAKARSDLVKLADEVMRREHRANKLFPLNRIDKVVTGKP